MAKQRAKIANHNKEFEQAQDSFFLNGDSTTLAHIYRIVYDLAKRYIINYGKNKNVYISCVDEKAHDVATTIIERKFILHKGAPIKKLTSYIYYDCLHEIVKEVQQDKRLDVWLQKNIIANGKGAELC